MINGSWISARMSKSSARSLWAPLVSVVIIRLIGSHTLPVYDDAYITFRYARNLAYAGSFVYNPGEWILGVTTPLFGIISALFYLVHLPMPTTVLFLNIILDGLISFLIYKALCESVSQTSAIVFVLLFAFSPTIVRVSVGCMESNLFLLGSVCAILLSQKKKMLPAIGLAAVLSFVRPEGAILIGLLLLKLIFARCWKKLLLSLSLVTIIVVPPLIYLQSVYGSFVPHSITVKSNDLYVSPLQVAQRLLVPEVFAIALLPLSIYGLALSLKGNSLLRMMSTWVGLYLASYLVMRPSVWSWYSLPVQFGLVLFAGIGLAHLIDNLKFFRGFAKKINLSYVGSFCAAITWVLLSAMQGESGVTRNIYEPLRAWGNGAGLESKMILATDIGAIGYYTNAYIYDGLGLVTPDAARHNALISVLREHSFDYLFLNATKETMQIFSDQQIGNRYSPIKRFSKAGFTAMDIDTKQYPNGWVQDYILFRLNLQTDPER